MARLEAWKSSQWSFKIWPVVGKDLDLAMFQESWTWTVTTELQDGSHHPDRKVKETSKA